MDLLFLIYYVSQRCDGRCCALAVVITKCDAPKVMCGILLIVVNADVYVKCVIYITNEVIKSQSITYIQLQNEYV